MNTAETKIAVIAALKVGGIFVPEMALLEALVERAMNWAEIAKKARDEGRAMTEEEVQAFVGADDESILRAKVAYERARAEGR